MISNQKTMEIKWNRGRDSRSPFRCICCSLESLVLIEREEEWWHFFDEWTSPSAQSDKVSAITPLRTRESLWNSSSAINTSNPKWIYLQGWQTVSPQYTSEAVRQPSLLWEEWPTDSPQWLWLPPGAIWYPVHIICAFFPFLASPSIQTGSPKCQAVETWYNNHKMLVGGGQEWKPAKEFHFCWRIYSPTLNVTRVFTAQLGILRIIIIIVISIPTMEDDRLITRLLN